MKVDKIREMDENELVVKVDQLKEEIFHTRIKKDTGQLEQVGALRELRRDLARVKTVLSERAKKIGVEAAPAGE